MAADLAIPELDEPPDLLIVVMTYDRPNACHRVLSRLEEAVSLRGARERTALIVLRDTCDGDYAGARACASAVAHTHVWLDATKRLGKRQFWRSYQAAMYFAQRWRPKRTLFLHDDVEFSATLFDEADAIWDMTADDPLRRVLYLFSSSKDEENGRWIHFPRKELGERSCRLTNWFDLQAFMVDLQFFELLNFRMVPIHPNRWLRKPTTSSGVGRQLTLRLFGRGNVYQAWPPLVSHGSEPSVANPEARAATDLDNRREYAAAEAQRAASRHAPSAT